MSEAAATALVVLSAIAVPVGLVLFVRHAIAEDRRHAARHREELDQ